MAPGESRETRVVAIRGHPFASRFQGEGGEVGVRDHAAPDAALAAVAGEDLPVSRAGCEHDGVRVVSNLGREGERVLERRGLAEDPGMGDDADEGAQDELSDAIGRIGREHVLKPVAVAWVVDGVFTMRVDEDVNVRQQHPFRP